MHCCVEADILQPAEHSAGWSILTSSQQCIHCMDSKTNQRETPNEEFYQTLWSPLISLVQPPFEQPSYSHLLSKLGSEHPAPGNVICEGSVLQLNQCGKMTVSFTVQAYF